MQLLISLLLVITTSLSLADDSRWRFTTNEEVISVGDIHGDYVAFIRIMQQAKLLDTQTNWIAGKKHFVCTGDFLDRGPDSRKVMDLLIKLEKQAASAGGKVHVLLGNHEVMNLIGNRQFVPVEEYAAFLADESAVERTRYYQQFLQSNQLDDNSAAKSRFNMTYPPGYFGLHAGFRPDGYYGNWLKEKPFIIIINGQLFTHGGLSAMVGKLGLSGINITLNKEMNDYAILWYSLIDDGLFKPDYSPQKRIELARLYSDTDIKHQGSSHTLIRKKAKQFLAVSDSDLNKQKSPIWYRGTALCHQYSEQPIVNEVLTQLGADKAILGHSVTLSREVESRFNGSVILQDTGMLKKAYQGQASLVIQSADSVQVFDDQHGLHHIQEQPPRVWKLPYGMTNEELENFLLTAKVIASKEIGTGVSKPLKLTLKKGKRTIHALYKNLDSSPGLEKTRRWPRDGNYADRYYHELAAYELNKLLTLDIIPPMVEREYLGKPGIFQYWIENGINRSEMITNKILYKGFCTNKSQKDLMRIFDALIYNDDRNTGNVFYKRDDWQIWLIDHSRAFRAKAKLPKGLEWSKLRLSDNFRQRLAALTKENLDKVLTKYLHEKQITYLLKRRNKILSKIGK